MNFPNQVGLGILIVTGKHKARLGRFGEQWHTPEMYELEIRMQEQRKGLWGRVFEGGWRLS